MKNNLRKRALGQLLANILFLAFIGVCVLMTAYALTCAILVIWSMCCG